MITIIILCVAAYFLALGVSATIQRNVDEYREAGYIEINLKWLLWNALYFIGQTLFPIVKYGFILIILLFLVGMVLLVGLLGGDDFGGGGSGDNFLPDFTEDWFYAESVFFGFIGIILVTFWDITKWVFVGLGAFIAHTCKLLFVSPFVWIRKKTSKLFDSSIFTIGSKPNKD
jgi:hypothetical protein